MMSKDLWEEQASRECPLPVVMMTDRSIGDMVQAFAALQVVAPRYPQGMVLVCNIPQLVQPMAPKNVNLNTGWLPWHSTAELFNISVGSSMNPRYGNPAKQILDHLGIESPAAIPQPEWRERTTTVSRNPNFVNGVKPDDEDYYVVKPIVYPEYDFLLHMNTDDDDRRWGFAQWGTLISALLKHYPDCSIGILGTDQVPLWNHHKPDPRPFACCRWWFLNGASDLREAKEDGSASEPGVEYVYNRSFELVGSLVKRAKKAVITIDSSVSRIAHAVKSKNHVLLCPEMYPVEWSSHPGCYNVIGTPETWRVDDVLEAVRLAVNGAIIVDTLYSGKIQQAPYAMPLPRKVDAQALWELRALLGVWTTWPRDGHITLRYTGGFDVIGKDVDLTRLSKAQVDHIVPLMQRANLFDHISTASEQNA